MALCVIAMLIWRAGPAPPAGPGNATSVFAAIAFHFVTSLAGVASGAANAPADAATASDVTAIATTRRTLVLLRFMGLHLLRWGPLDGNRPDPSRSQSSS